MYDIEQIENNELFMSLVRSSKLEDLLDNNYFDHIFRKSKMKLRLYKTCAIYVKDYVKSEAELRNPTPLPLSVLATKDTSIDLEEQANRILAEGHIKPTNVIDSINEDEDFKVIATKLSSKKSKSGVGTMIDVIRKQADMYPKMTNHREHFNQYKEYVNSGNAVGAKEKQDFIVNSNLKLVFSAIKLIKFTNSDIVMEEMIQSGYEGLIRAVKTYNPDFSKFSTYAIKCIRNEIYRYLNQATSKLKASPEASKLVRNIKKIKTLLFNENGGIEPTYEAIAQRYFEVHDKFITSEDVKVMLETANPIVSSIHTHVSEDDDSTELLDIIVDPHSPDPSEAFVNVELRDKLYQIIDTLGHREANVLYLRYGLNKYNRTFSLEEIAKVMNLSKERIRQIVNEAVNQLSHYGKMKHIYDFMYNEDICL